MLEKFLKTQIADPRWVENNKRILMAYMRAHPIITPALARLPSHQADRFIFSPFAPALLASIALFVTGGVSFASQNSLPGDFLYTWKVGVVENIESVFIAAPGRADFEVELTSKRLKEMTELTARKISGSQAVAQARVRLENQIMKASATIEKTAEKDKEKALEAAVRLGAALNAHQNVLTTIEAKIEEESKAQVQEVISAIQENVPGVQGTIETLKTQSKEESSGKSAEDLKSKTATKMEETKKRLDEMWTAIIVLDESDGLRMGGELKLRSAQEAILNAESAAANASYTDALLELQSASQLISDTEALLEAAQESGVSTKEILGPSPSATPTAEPTILPASSSLQTDL